MESAGFGSAITVFIQSMNADLSGETEVYGHASGDDEDDEDDVSVDVGAEVGVMSLVLWSLFSSFSSSLLSLSSLFLPGLQSHCRNDGQRFGSVLGAIGKPMAGFQTATPPIPMIIGRAVVLLEPSVLVTTTLLAIVVG